MALLNGQGPIGELAQLGILRALVELGDDRPVADLPRLGHRQELEPVERISLVAEVGVTHLGGLLLYLASLCQDGRLLSLELGCQVGAAGLGLTCLVAGLRQLLGQRLVLGTQHSAHLPRGILSRHGQPEHFGKLAL